MIPAMGLSGGPATVEMLPVCEACGEEDEQLRRLLALTGRRGIDVPNVAFRSPFLCAVCRQRVCNFIRSIISLEREEAIPAIPEPEGSPA